MRTRGFLSYAALTVCIASTAFAQTPPAKPAPDSAPVPTPGTTQEYPAYAPQPQPKQQQKTEPPAAPAPETKGPVVAPPTKPTPEAPYVGYVPYAPVALKELKPPPDRLSSVYIPVDSWIYPELTRLYGMGFLDTMFLSMRPYTQRSVLHMLQKSEDAILSSDNIQAQDILAKILYRLSAEVPDGNVPRGFVYGVDSSYTRFLGIGGPILRDSYHLGQTISNDYGRPFETRLQCYRGCFDGRGVGAVFVVCQGRVRTCSVRHRLLARDGRHAGHQR